MHISRDDRRKRAMKYCPTAASWAKRYSKASPEVVPVDP
jgi:hypothetical protein